MIAIEETDEELVGSVLAGNRENFSVLVDRYKRGIANFIGASVRSSADVADLTQETFLRAYAHLGTFNPELGQILDLGLPHRAQRRADVPGQVAAPAADDRSG